MTVTLHLTPKVEAGLLARAEASGMALEEYLLSLAEEAALQIIPGAAATSQKARGEAVRRMLEFGEKHHLTLGEPITRKLLHEGHRF
jgi:hypothetical protein